VLVGDFEGTISVQSTLLTSKGSLDLFIASYQATASGTLLWANSHGGADEDQVSDVSVTPAGDAVITGAVGSGDLGGGPFTITGLVPFVARYDKLGGHIWSRRYTGTDAQGYSVATDDKDTVLLGGIFKGTLDLEGTVHTI
jgi:hypothetical protein